MHFAQKHYLITGAAQGIGKATALALAKKGACIYLTDINDFHLNETLVDVRAYSPLSQSFHVDIRNTDHIQALMHTLDSQQITLDGLVNVAGVLHLALAADMSIEAWQHTFDVNTHGVFNLCKAVVPQFIRKQHGTIVTVGSNAAHVPRQQMAAYCASKAATHQYIKCLGLELAQYNVRCNIVAPGSTLTPMQTQLWENTIGTLADKKTAVIQGSQASYRNGIPLQRMAEPYQIADVVLFLLSDAASHITMETLTVDGGASLGT